MTDVVLSLLNDQVVSVVRQANDIRLAGGGQGVSGVPGANVLTTRGDMIRRNAVGPERFAIGTLGQHLQAGASDPDWTDTFISEKAFNLGLNGSSQLRWMLDAVPFSFSLATGAFLEMPTAFSGMLVINEITATGAVGVFICGGGAVALLATTNTGVFVATATAGRVNMQYNAPRYRIFNQFATSLTFSAFVVRTRNTA